MNQLKTQGKDVWVETEWRPWPDLPPTPPSVFRVTCQDASRPCTTRHRRRSRIQTPCRPHSPASCTSTSEDERNRVKTSERRGRRRRRRRQRKWAAMVGSLSRGSVLSSDPTLAANDVPRVVRYTPQVSAEDLVRPHSHLRSGVGVRVRVRVARPADCRGRTRSHRPTGGEANHILHGLMYHTVA